MLVVLVAEVTQPEAVEEVLALSEVIILQITEVQVVMVLLILYQVLRLLTEAEAEEQVMEFLMKHQEELVVAVRAVVVMELIKLFLLLVLMV
jgi:hypothetical protein